MPPAMPAYTAEIAKAQALVLRTFMPDADATCSLSRIAHIARPNFEVVRYIVAAMTSTRMRAITGKAVGSVPTRYPKMLGATMRSPSGPPVTLSQELNTHWAASAKAKVASARYTVRSRVAGNPMSRPIKPASNAARGLPMTHEIGRAHV